MLIGRFVLVIWKGSVMGPSSGGDHLCGCASASAKLGSLCGKLPGVPFMAVTATATQSDISALQQALRCHENKVGVQLFVDPFSCPNLHLTVVSRRALAATTIC